ncbi:thioesterase-like superfamily-domain-containing protein [Aspergillus avenaceus]|uniref:Thioesterase-like superfamily-domain-containing protein n=1 Tax=Aspergillus avenaceus TaxID=36643 RepID=A0A5N6TTG1_ASPAV|nr:thioesterase-like superfamily-domain-containing protein [Aspergillus avenaceus]
MLPPGADGPDYDTPDLRSPRSFVELMALKQLDDPGHLQGNSTDEPEKVERFQSLAGPYPPGEGKMAFGGHVYAQSAYAASKTVGQGFVINDMIGTFILPGRLDIAFVYTVRHLRDGKGYCTRAVDARQAGKICFSCLCSFKRNEGPQTFSHQPPSAQERYKSILTAKRPEEQPISPSVDVDWWIRLVEQGNVEEREFPGLDVRKVDMKGYNQTEDIRQNPEKYRQLTLYALKGSPQDPGSSVTREELREKEKSGEYDNLYACAHMYSSDKNSLLMIARALRYNTWTAMASLTLTVIFHQHGDSLRMIDWDAAPGKDEVESPKKWFIQEGWTPRSGENRAIHESWLWSPDGKLIATSYQDSMLRVQPQEREKKL